MWQLIFYKLIHLFNYNPMSHNPIRSELMRVSKWAGERFDLVQAGGGNTSIKDADGTLHIKASGFALSEVEIDDGVVSVGNQSVIDIIQHSEVRGTTDKKQREQRAEELLKISIGEQSYRASIEVYLHAVLSRVTLHTHSVIVNALTCRTDWREIIEELFPDALCVPYSTPGIDLAISMETAVASYVDVHGKKPTTVFLQNHGLIVSGESVEFVTTETDRVVMAIEKTCAVDFSRYRSTNAVSAVLRSIDPESDTIAFLSEDVRIQQLVNEHAELLERTPFSPDGFVFCGGRPVVLQSITDVAAITAYQEEFHELPRVLIIDNMIYCVAKNVKKAQEVEVVFKFHLLALHSAGNDVHLLPSEELHYLGNWDAEKYRRALKK